MILIIDNYDSFTYNIIQQVGEFCSNIKVLKNNEASIVEIEKYRCTHIIISPGPGSPQNAGESANIVRHFYEKIPILGVCLGHQVIGEIFKCSVNRHSEIVHGKTSHIYHNEISRLFKNVPRKFNATRYHSLIIDNNQDKNIIVNAWLDDKTIMGIEHKKYPLFGVQFHPESIATKCGGQIIKNFLKIV